MALLKDALSNSGGTPSTASFNWTHTPVGTPRAVLVAIQASGNAAPPNVVDHPTVTYGGVAMTRIGTSWKAAAEIGASHLFFLGASIPTGAQTVAVTLANTDWNCRGSAVSVTGAADTEVVDVDETINSGAVANPSVTLSLGGRSCFCAIAGVSGQNTVGGSTPTTDWTSDDEFDFGGQCTLLYTYDIVSTTDVAAGWTQASEDAMAVAVAIAEVAGGGISIPVVYHHRQRNFG